MLSGSYEFNYVTLKAFNIGKVWNQHVTMVITMVTERLRSYCGTALLESYYRESNISDTN